MRRRRGRPQRRGLRLASRDAGSGRRPERHGDRSTGDGRRLRAAAGASASSGHGAQVASLALAEHGKPYVWAAAGPNAFDCSGLVMYVFAQIGISLPHSSYAQVGMGSPVDLADLQPGDLVFFNGDSHVGIYIGGGNMVHAPHTGDVVRSSASPSTAASTPPGASSREESAAPRRIRLVPLDLGRSCARSGTAQSASVS